MIGYVIGLEKLSTKGQVFVDSQIAVCLEHSAGIISGVYFITAHVAYASTNKIKII